MNGKIMMPGMSRAAETQPAYRTLNSGESALLQNGCIRSRGNWTKWPAVRSHAGDGRQQLDDKRESIRDSGRRKLGRKMARKPIGTAIMPRTMSPPSVDER
jgi:hypothetical protein